MWKREEGKKGRGRRKREKRGKGKSKIRGGGENKGLGKKSGRRKTQICMEGLQACTVDKLGGKSKATDTRAIWLGGRRRELTAWQYVYF